MDICKIVHNDYDRISDRVMWLSTEWMLKFTVDLNRKSTHNGRTTINNFHKEFGYTTDDGRFAIKVNREFNYYLSIESYKKGIDGIRSSIKIGINDIFFVRARMQELIYWFTGNDMKDLFMKQNGRIKIHRSVNPIKIILQKELCSLEFEPAVQYVNDVEQWIGVNCYVNGSQEPFFMNVNTTLAFANVINTFDMYQAAISLLNYIGRPSYGTNMIDIDQNTNNKPKANTGFFSRTGAKQIIGGE
jgi:hypothetical protein